MKKVVSYHSTLETYDSPSDLSEGQQMLISKAQESLNSSYSPYSGFAVGTCILLDDGTLVQGSNQENIAFPSGLCAERVALFSIGANYPDHTIISMAIVAKSEHGAVPDPVTPCGACRQVMIEIEGRQEQPIEVIMAGDSGTIWISKSVENLIPFYFKSLGDDAS